MYSIKSTVKITSIFVALFTINIFESFERDFLGGRLRLLEAAAVKYLQNIFNSLTRAKGNGGQKGHILADNLNQGDRFCLLQYIHPPRPPGIFKNIAPPPCSDGPVLYRTITMTD